MTSKSKTGSILRRIASKELTLFFSSPVAYLFLAGFVSVTLFIVFWGEAFFARNIADVRPMFEWMPILLIFLCSPLTMRMWSEERRSGTLEHVLTQPVSLWHFVVGKFMSCLALLAVALMITTPLPLTVGFLAELDWGPVLAGYLATFLLGAAYLSIGLFVSARSPNQIVSLLTSVAVCGLFYLVGSPLITGLLGGGTAEVFRLLGSGSRYESITRGVVDLRDLIFYLSIVTVFLALNSYALEKERWGKNAALLRHQSWKLLTGLLVANALAANLWACQVESLRVDTTRGQLYSISAPTATTLKQLQEPLLIRGYFSNKTHPLLAPLIPQLKDLLREYAVAGGSEVRVEFVDPAEQPDLEEEAGQLYGIQPIPFQVADRYQASVVSSYFQVLLKYGTEYKVLGFQDFIEVKGQNPQDVQVQLRNPEYDLTRAIKKLVNTYQANGSVFSTLDKDLTLEVYVTKDSSLPKQLLDFKKTMTTVLDKTVKASNGRFKYRLIDPTVSGAQVAESLAQDYGVRPMSLSPDAPETFYFSLLLRQDDKTVPIGLDSIDDSSFERNLQTAIKKFAPGFTKAVALVTPPDPIGDTNSGQTDSWVELQSFLESEMTVIHEDLSDGRISESADILLVVGPKNFEERSLYAIDQFLMRGGTMLLSTSPFSAEVGSDGPSLNSEKTGLEDWLNGYGISMAEVLVLDPQSVQLAAPVTRMVGALQVQEMRLIDYPFFIDARSQQLNTDHPILRDISQATLTWASPLTIDQEKNKEREVVELIRSSDESWLSTSKDIVPKVSPTGESGFPPQGTRASQLLATVVSGSFESSFAKKESPLSGESTTVSVRPLERSPASARLIVFGSSDFLKDRILQVLGGATGGQYLNTVQMMANAIDWSLEDSSLMQIRSRGHFNRTLPPMEQRTRMAWEYANYILAALGLVCVAGIQRIVGARRRREYQQWMTGAREDSPNE